MHRKQAQDEGSHESRDNGVSRVMRIGSHESLEPMGLMSQETLRYHELGDPGVAWTECNHRVKGLTSHEALSGLEWTECKHRVKGLMSHETPGYHES